MNIMSHYLTIAHCVTGMYSGQYSYVPVLIHV